MDAREASLEARKYFEETRDTQPLSFDVEDAKLEDDTWIIRCSFYRNPLEARRTTYVVKISDKDKKILNVAQLPSK